MKARERAVDDVGGGWCWSIHDNRDGTSVHCAQEPSGEYLHAMNLPEPDLAPGVPRFVAVRKWEFHRPDTA